VRQRFEIGRTVRISANGFRQLASKWIAGEHRVRIADKFAQSSGWRMQARLIGKAFRRFSIKATT
jgi:hypothetical protein